LQELEHKTRQQEIAIEELRAAKPARDDVGPDSAAEAARLRSCVETLQAEKRCLELTVEGLEREVEELRRKLATNGEMMREVQATIKKWEDTVETQRSIIAKRESELASLRAGAAAPPADEMPPIPGFLDRTKQGAAS